jgi:hypothetical protein
LTVRSATVTATAEGQKLLGEGRVVTVGDGIHIHDFIGGLDVRDVHIADSARAGLFINLGARVLTSTAFQNVTIEVSSPEIPAALVQDGTPPMDWDADINRIGRQRSDDLAVTMPFSVIGPCDFTAPAP